MAKGNIVNLKLDPHLAHTLQELHGPWTRRLPSREKQLLWTNKSRKNKNLRNIQKYRRTGCNSLVTTCSSTRFFTFLYQLLNWGTKKRWQPLSPLYSWHDVIIYFISRWRHRKSKGQQATHPSQLRRNDTDTQINRCSVKLQPITQAVLTQNIFMIDAKEKISLISKLSPMKEETLRPGPPKK